MKVNPLLSLGAWSTLLGIGVANADILVPGTGGPDPTDPGVVLWLDASDAGTLFQDLAETTPVADGSNVAVWKDKSMLGLTFAQTNATRLPLYKAMAPSLGNASALSFAADFLDCTTGNATGIDGAEAITVVTVFQATAFTGAFYQHVFHMGNPSVGQSYGHSASRNFNLGGSGVGNHYWGDGFNSMVNANVDASFVLSSYDGLRDHWYVNGRFAGEHPVALNLGVNEMDVGSRIAPYAEGFTGDLAEVIVFNVVLTDIERDLLGTYINAKYGITIEEEPVDPDFSVILPTTGAPNPAHPDLRFWVDSSDPATLWQDTAGTIPAADGLPVARWDDKSMSGIVTLQNSVGNRPVLTGSVADLNGVTAVSFTGNATDGAGDALSSTTANTTGIVGLSEVTLVTVWQNTGFISRNLQHVFHMGDAATRQSYGHSSARIGNAGTGIGNHYWNDAFDNTAATASLEPHMAFSSYDGFSTDTWWINGVPGGSYAVQVSLGGEGLQVGSRVAPISEGFSGHLAEVILIAGVLTDEERNGLGFYVQNKYGLTIQDAALAVDPAVSFTAVEVSVDPMTDTATVTLDWVSNIAGVFRFEYSPDLETWLEINDNEAGVVGANTSVDVIPDASMTPMRYYRLSLISM